MFRRTLDGVEWECESKELISNCKWTFSSIHWRRRASIFLPLLAASCNESLKSESTVTKNCCDVTDDTVSSLGETRIRTQIEYEKSSFHFHFYSRFNRRPPISLVLWALTIRSMGRTTEILKLWQSSARLKLSVWFVIEEQMLSSNLIYSRASTGSRAQAAAVRISHLPSIWYRKKVFLPMFLPCFHASSSVDLKFSRFHHHNFLFVEFGIQRNVTHIEELECT